MFKRAHVCARRHGGKGVMDKLGNNDIIIFSLPLSHPTFFLFKERFRRMSAAEWPVNMLKRVYVSAVKK